MREAVDTARSETADSDAHLKGERVRELGRISGFDVIRIGPVGEMHAEKLRYVEWVRSGRQAGMQWMTEERAARSAAPDRVFPAAQSVISVGMNYWSSPRRPVARNRGKIARYAWGRDYHAVLGEKLQNFASELKAEFGAASQWYVDTGPVMDKALAARSGLGWYGKNTNILTEQFGSWVLLGELLTDLLLEQDAPLERTCGSCRVCRVACPTGALDTEYQIDGGKCISYLTIEHRGSIPRDLRSKMGDWVFGCDICQDVCPPTMQPFLRTPEERREWVNQVKAHVQKRAENYVHPRHVGEQAGTIRNRHCTDNGAKMDVDLLELLEMTHDDYLVAFRGTSIRRAKVWMLRRNAAIALGNVGDPSAAPYLHRSMQHDEHPVVRSHAAWAIGRLTRRHGMTQLRLSLVAAYESELDPDVRREIGEALNECEPMLTGAPD